MKIADASFIASAANASQLPPPAFAEVAFAGRSNVGKSSLINALVQRRNLVRTSSTPGCTRGINLFRVTITEPDAVLDLVDLPGYGFAKRSKAERRGWGSLIEEFLRSRDGLRGVIVIVDVRRGVEADDRALLEFLDFAGRPAVVVATKLDKLPISQRKPRLAEVRRQAGRRVVGFSAPKADGRDPLMDSILRLAAIDVGG